jgi:hypothetical protein
VSPVMREFTVRFERGPMTATIEKIRASDAREALDLARQQLAEAIGEEKAGSWASVEVYS